MNGRKLVIFQGGVEEMEWGRGSLLRDLGKRDTNIISVCDCGRGHLWLSILPWGWRVGICEKYVEGFYMGCR